MTAAADWYSKIAAFLSTHRIPYESVPHAPAARAEEYSRALGSRLEQQAKCLMVQLIRGDATESVLAALPACDRLDLVAVARYTGADRARLVPSDRVQPITGCRVGALFPIGSVLGLPVLFSSRLLDHDRIYLNAGCLDRSVIVPPRLLVAADRPDVW